MYIRVAVKYILSDLLFYHFCPRELTYVVPLILTLRFNRLKY